jgi:hypothetical protein
MTDFSWKSSRQKEGDEDTKNQKEAIGEKEGNEKKKKGGFT